MRLKRRTFLQGCCAGIVAMGGSKLGNLVFAQRGEPQRDIIINIFLRGGMDALSFLAPFGDAEYVTKRTALALTNTTTHLSDIDGYFGLHIAAAPLMDLYDAQHLAIIPASGIPDNMGTRSHFDAQDIMDYGGADESEGGWLARYLSATSAGNLPFDGLFRAISYGAALSPSFGGFPEALALTGAGDFTINGTSSHIDDLRRALRLMYDYDPELRDVAARTLEAVDVLDANPPGDYVPSPGTTYQDNDFADALQSVAQIIKMDIGLQAATIDLGGWDTHESQANSGNPHQGSFATLVGELANGLASFWQDMDAQRSRITVVVMSEFGRRLRENANRGTDHGHGGLMAVLSTHLVEKKIWGEWPGLATGQLYEANDLRVTTDFRKVLGEIFVARVGASLSDLATFFPGYTYADPLGLFGAAGMPNGVEGFIIR